MRSLTTGNICSKRPKERRSVALEPRDQPLVSRLPASSFPRLDERGLTCTDAAPNEARAHALAGDDRVDKRPVLLAGQAVGVGEDRKPSEPIEIGAVSGDFGGN